MIDAVTLRQVLTAFLPTGGVIDRLGDSREKARDKARETLVILGGFAYRSSSSAASSKSKEGKGPETPLMIFERFIREGGLGSKVWKTRAQVRQHSFSTKIA
jgi:CLIP-associating protein 1/2